MAGMTRTWNIPWGRDESSSEEASVTSFLLMLLVTGILGIFLGVLLLTPQFAIEQGQVLSGVVRYPANNPSYIYDVKLWNLWAQLSGLGLYLGVSEFWITLFLNALAGLLIVWGFALWIYAFTRNLFYSALAPFVCVFCVAVLAFEGFTYPVVMVGSVHTYGMLGLSFMLVVLGFLAVGYSRLGFFLLGFALCVHPSLGGWTNLTVFTALLLNFKSIRIWWKPARYAVIGYAISAASYLFQRLAYPVTYLDPAAASKYLSAYLQYWDYHRGSSFVAAVFADQAGLIILVNAIVISLIALWLYRKDWSEHVRLALTAVPVVVALGLGATIYSELPLPGSNIVSVLLPARFLNLAVYLYIALVIGLLWRYRQVSLLGLILFILLVASLASPVFNQEFQNAVIFAVPSVILVIVLLKKKGVPRRILWIASLATSAYFIIFSTGLFRGDVLSIGIKVAISIVIANILIWVQPKAQNESRVVISNRWERVLSSVTLLTMIAIAALLFEWEAVQTPDRWNIVANPKDSILTAVSEGKGMLLTGALAVEIQLTTRRSVLLAASMDGLPYSIEGAPQTVNILRDIYGVDFFNPPLEVQHKGSYPVTQDIQNLWQARSQSEWIDLANQYAFTQVLTPSTWILQLPIAAQGNDQILYDVPSSK